MFVIRKDLQRADAKLVSALGKISTATLSDAMGRAGAMCSLIKGVFPGARLAGPAYTVKNCVKDNLMSHYALKHASPGDILVVSNGGFFEASGWGELMSTAAKSRRLGGVVIDGGVRDVIALKELNFPVFARGFTPEGTFKSTPGSVNVPITCGGITVCPGDAIVADDDGVVVIPRERAACVLEESKKTLRKERDIRRRVLAGESLFDLFGLEAYLDTGAVKKG
jgi:4-hydroxy-4-methyl-2-oxoglutarate aldolase